MQKMCSAVKLFLTYVDHPQQMCTCFAKNSVNLFLWHSLIVDVSIKEAEAGARGRPHDPVWVLGFLKALGFLTILFFAEIPRDAIGFKGTKVQCSEAFAI